MKIVNEYYVMIIFSVLLFSVQFVFTKCYQKERGAHFSASILQLVLSSAFFIPLYLIMNNFKVEFTFFSFIIALLYSINGMLCTIFGMKVLEKTTLSVYTLFLMLGGMIVPFVYGLFTGESFTLIKAVAVILVALSLLVDVKKEDDKKVNLKLILCCMMIFLTNGLAHVLTYIHQRSTLDTVNTSSFLLLAFMCKLVITGGLLSWIMFNKKKIEPIEKEPVCVQEKGKALRSWLVTIGVIIGYVVVSGLAQWISAYTAVYVDAGIKSTIITGGCIVMSAFFGLIFGEKITLIKILQLALALVGVVLMML